MAVNPTANHIFTISFVCSVFLLFFHALSVLSVCIIQAPVVSVSSPQSITPSSVFEHHSTADSSVLSCGWVFSSLTCLSLNGVWCTQSQAGGRRAPWCCWRRGWWETRVQWGNDCMQRAAAVVCFSEATKASGSRDSDLVGSVPPLSLCPAVALPSPLSLNSHSF